MAILLTGRMVSEEAGQFPGLIMPRMSDIRLKPGG